MCFTVVNNVTVFQIFFLQRYEIVVIVKNYNILGKTF